MSYSTKVILIISFKLYDSHSISLLFHRYCVSLTVCSPHGCHTTHREAVFDLDTHQDKIYKQTHPILQLQRERERGRGGKTKNSILFGTHKTLIALPSVLSSARFTLSSSLNRRLCCFRSVSVAPNGCKSFRYVDDGVIMANSKERGTR